MPEEKSFWNSVPGILTGLAAVITALGGVLAIYYQAHRPDTPATQIQGITQPSPPRTRAPAIDKPKSSGHGEGPQPATPCSRTFPDSGEVQGTRVLYFDSDESARGAEVYVNGKCQGYLGSSLSGRLEHNMLINVPPGDYEILVRKKGYKDFKTTLTVLSSNSPYNLTPKVLVRFQLALVNR